MTRIFFRYHILLASGVDLGKGRLFLCTAMTLMDVSRYDARDLPSRFPGFVHVSIEHITNTVLAGSRSSMVLSRMLIIITSNP